MQEVAQSVSRHFGVVFESQMLWLDTLEALVGEPGDVPLRVPGNLRKMHGEGETFLA